MFHPANTSLSVSILSAFPAAYLWVSALQQYADLAIVMFMAVFTTVTLAALIIFGGYWFFEARRLDRLRREALASYDLLRKSQIEQDYPSIRSLKTHHDLYELIEESFNLEEIEEMIFHLSFEYNGLNIEMFPRETKGRLLRAFWGYATSRKMISSIKQWVIEKRPGLNVDRQNKSRS